MNRLSGCPRLVTAPPAQRLRSGLLVACSLALSSLIGCSDDPAAVKSDVDTSVDASETTADVTEPEVDIPERTVFCNGATTFSWNPDDDATLVAFPDDALSVDDAGARTGQRVKIGDPRWLGDQPAFFQSVYHQLEGLDGFGTSAGIVLRFSAPLAAPPSGSATGSATGLDAKIVLFDLSVTPARELPFETQVLDEGATIIVWPMRPLREEALHGVVVTTRMTDAGGGCVAPSPSLQAVLAPAQPGTPSAALIRLQPRFDTLVDAAGALAIAPGDISAATVFTTQSYSAATLKQREHLLTQSYDWKSRPKCDNGATIVECEGDFFANDYRIEGYLGDAFASDYAPKTYRLPVHIWLPKVRSAAAPILVFGHGLGGSAEQAAQIAEVGAEQGLATIAISAPRHGDHPTATSNDPQAIFTEFFGIDLQAFSIDGFVFRENVRQAAFDKLQVMQLLAAHPDIDGDGVADLDTSRVAYWGISLGGILGPNFVAMSDKIGAAIFSIAGARVISIISEGADFKQFFDLLAQISGGPDNLLRQAPVAQALIDGADPIGWARYLIDDRIGRPNVAPPHILLQMVMGDTTVPNIATRSLARALATPQVPKVITPIDLLTTEASAPVSGNVDIDLAGADGVVTMGLFQLDRVTTSPGGNPKKATHSGVFSGIEAIDQVSRFLETWLDEGVPTIVDPYVENDTKPL